MQIRRVLGVVAVAAAAAVVTATPASTGLVVVNPDATIVVSDLTPAEGDTITVSNAANSDSTCEDGTAVVFIGGLPPGDLSQKVATPDASGNWEVEVFFPFQADWPSNAVSGPFEIEAFCFDAEDSEVTARAEPEFGYVPVTVTLAQTTPAPGPDPGPDPGPGPETGAEAVPASPSFAG